MIYTPRKELTSTQQGYYTAIVDFIVAHRVFPTYRELFEAMGLKSPSSAQLAVKSLVSKGWIEEIPRDSIIDPSRTSNDKPSRGYRLTPHLVPIAGNQDQRGRTIPARSYSVCKHGSNVINGYWIPAEAIKCSR